MSDEKETLLRDLIAPLRDQLLEILTHSLLTLKRTLSILTIEQPAYLQQQLNSRPD